MSKTLRSKLLGKRVVSPNCISRSESVNQSFQNNRINLERLFRCSECTIIVTDALHIHHDTF
jgi:aspartate carbamoyltransferase regulatory subunit